MGASILRFDPLRSRRTRNWSPQELSDLYRVVDILGRAGLPVDTELGLSDEGEPWFVFCRPETGEVVAHFARIDGRFVAVSTIFPHPLTGHSLRSIIETLMQRQPLLLPQAPSGAGTKLFLHPAVMLTAFVATALAQSQSEALAADGAGERTVAAPRPEAKPADDARNPGPTGRAAADKTGLDAAAAAFGQLSVINALAIATSVVAGSAAAAKMPASAMPGGDAPPPPEAEAPAAPPPSPAEDAAAELPSATPQAAAAEPTPAVADRRLDVDAAPAAPETAAIAIAHRADPAKAPPPATAVEDARTPAVADPAFAEPAPAADAADQPAPALPAAPAAPAKTASGSVFDQYYAHTSAEVLALIAPDADAAQKGAPLGKEPAAYDNIDRILIYAFDEAHDVDIDGHRSEVLVDALWRHKVAVADDTRVVLFDGDNLSLSVMSLGQDVVMIDLDLVYGNTTRNPYDVPVQRLAVADHKQIQLLGMITGAELLDTLAATPG